MDANISKIQVIDIQQVNKINYIMNIYLKLPKGKQEAVWTKWLYKNFRFTSHVLLNIAKYQKQMKVEMV